MKDVKVLVLGGSGMLGHKVFQRLSARFPRCLCTVHGAAPAAVELFSRGSVVEHVDAMDTDRMQSLLDDHRPDVLVNCIGVIKQRLAARSPIPSIALNALLPHRLADWLSRHGGRLIHFSTDCVFSGRKGAYEESDVSDAEDIYGRTKFLGEVTDADNAITLRTSIIGRELRHRQSLLEWFLAQNHGRVKGFRHAMWSGVSTNWLASVVERLVLELDGIHGLFQVTGPTLSKYELLTILRDAFRLDVQIDADETFICDRSMSGNHFERVTGITCPNWQKLAEELANDPTPYGRWQQ